MRPHAGHGDGSGAAVIDVAHLAKRYGSTVALADVTFTVAEGEIFGLLGPNGAGKTTTVESIVGLRVPDSGTIRMLGLDPRADGAVLRETVGVQLQESALPPKLRVSEAVSLYTSFYRRPADAQALVESLGLSAKQHAYYRDLSGGQKQRLSIVLALIGSPTIAVLDELTTGLDPQARRAIWDLVRDIRERGKTVFLTTHLMEEAERLCDRVAIIDEGQIIEIGTPREIQQRTLGQSRIEIRCEQPLPPTEIDSIFAAEKHAFSDDRKTLTVHSTHPAKTIVELVKWIDQHGVELSDIHLKRPTLEDVFIELTGKRLRE